MSYTNPEALVDADWLEAHHQNPSIKIIDASWHMPNIQRNAYEEYQQSHIPGAFFFDIDLVSDGESDLPHMLPPAAQFEQAVSQMGVQKEDLVVIYDSYGLFSAARVWWMFKIFGHDKVAILNGGFMKWKNENRPTTHTITKAIPSVYQAVYQENLICDLGQMLQTIDQQQIQVIDARAADRFYGRVPEPRPGLRAGHIPGSLNLPFATLLNEDKTLKSEQDLCNIFNDINLDLTRPIYASCGTGVTACILSFALYLCGKTDTAIYDGSWTEWGGHQETPVA